MKNSTNNALPSDFFENSTTPAVNFKLPQKALPVVDSVPSGGDSVAEGDPADVAKTDANAMVVDVSLPEGFFDDPLLDAKVRDTDYLTVSVIFFMFNHTNCVICGLKSILVALALISH